MKPAVQGNFSIWTLMAMVVGSMDESAAVDIVRGAPAAVFTGHRVTQLRGFVGRGDIVSSS